MKLITKAEFIEGYENGTIREVVAIQDRVYGRRVATEDNPVEVVFVQL